MDPLVTAILACLDRVDVQRQQRAADPALAQGVAAVKRHQHARFARTYADFLADPTTAPAALFFLNELYGPGDFSLRDGQFRRIVPSLPRFFPSEVARTVLQLAQLHALTEELDSAMGEYCSPNSLGEQEYAQAWRQTGRAAARDEQIRLMLEIGLAIDALARRSLVRASLKLMRGPAAAAGFGKLQNFLESGLEAFRTLESPSGFLQTIAERERQLAHQLFTTKAAS